MNDLMTPAALSKKYPVSRSTIYAACGDGLLAFYRVPSKRGARGKYLIKETDFLAWLESNRHEAGDEPPPVTAKPKPSRPALKHLNLG